MNNVYSEQQRLKQAVSSAYYSEQQRLKQAVSSAYYSEKQRLKQAVNSACYSEQQRLKWQSLAMWRRGKSETEADITNVESSKD